MTEQQVDVIDRSGTVLHTYPITAGESGNADESRNLAEALEAAAHGRLVPNAELGTLSAKIHTSWGGQMALYEMTLRGIRIRNVVWSKPFGNALF